MTDLYAALDLPRDAPIEAVRPAYRRAAKRAHPDRGGTRESFALVKMALDTLGDEKRRAHYDRTGEIDDKPVDQTEAMALSIAMNAVDAVLNTIAQRRGRVEEFDVVSDAIAHLRNVSAEIDQKTTNTHNEAARIRRMAKRFKAKRGKVNRIRQMLEARADALERDTRMSREERERVVLAIGILQDHEFETDCVGGMMIGRF